MKTRFKFLLFMMLAGFAIFQSCTSRTTSTNMRNPDGDTTTIGDNSIRTRTDTTMNRGSNIDTDTTTNWDNDNRTWDNTNRNRTDIPTNRNTNPTTDTMMNRNNNTTTDPMNRNNTNTTGMPMNQGTTSTVGNQGEALLLVMTVDMNEINVSELAREKQLSKDVLDYANMLYDHHTRSLQKSDSLVQTMSGVDTTMQSTMVTNLRQKGDRTLATLTPLSGAAFERAFLDAMVQDHQAALTMIDNQLLPAAQDQTLRNHLTKTREKIAMHLERAQALQKNRQ